MLDSKADHLGLAKPRRAIGFVIISVALCCSFVVLYLFGNDLYTGYQIRTLIENAYNKQRPGGGRLFGTPYSELTSATGRQLDLGRAQVLLLRRPDSEERQRLQGMIYLASGNWRAFVDSVNQTSPQMRRDPAILNNLGASFLALSDMDPTYLLKALDEFEQAVELDPRALEPRFNLVVTYRKLRLSGLAGETLHRYEGLEPSSVWYRELTNRGESDESSFLDELRRAIENNDLSDAQRLFDKNPELCRRTAMQHGLSNVPESPALVRFIAGQIERRFGDKTVSAMLAPLFTSRKDITIAVRSHVREGAELYLQGNLTRSLEAYSNADKLIDQTDPAFDRLWIDINRVDTQIRVGEFELARESLQRVVSSAREHGFVWLQAKALSIYGTTLRLTPSYGEMLTLLAEAEHMFADIGAPHDRVRPLYYLAIYQYGAGDHAEALRLALDSLRLTDDDDVVRMSSLDLLIGSILYRQGMAARAVLFEQESVGQSRITKNPGLEATAAATLAQLYEYMSEQTLAEHYLSVAEDAFKRVPAGFDQTRTEVVLNMVKSRMDMNRKRYKDAESLAERNLKIYSQQPFQVIDVTSQALTLLARSYSETGRIWEAAQKFNEAIEMVEMDDRYLQSEKLRVKFDDERRELYDSAIEFEYKHGSPDAAWTYLQKYRAKLFLEFLGQFNLDIERIRGQALNRSRVQKLVPHDTQIIEYALLKDHLLIWFISDNVFKLFSVPVSRSVLEGEVQQTLQKLRSGQNADTLLKDLGKVLVEPVADMLDPARTIAIIPDRALHGLPFPALRRPGRREYLIQNFTIIVSPTLTHLLATNGGRPQRNAIVSFGSQNDDSTEIRELTALKDFYPKAMIVAGHSVEKTNFLAAMNTAPVFHYAGHSVTDAVDPLRSSILLDGNRNGQNRVTAVDISRQRLWSNAIVVLSSCDSSVGNSRDGVGMRGLTSAFLIGGAGSVVGSLWPVEGSSTADLMIRFHRAFASAQMPVAQALRRAQLDFLEAHPERSHPYYWSGFVVTGNFSALR